MPGDAAGFLRAPRADDDKYSRGVVALRTGSAAYPGAAVLSVEATWRSGAGYVHYLGDAAEAVLARRPETVIGGAETRVRADAWVIGSGTDPQHRGDDEQAALQRILGGTVPVVMDAGSLDLAAEGTAPRVLTPHAGELRRLCETLALDAAGADGTVTERAAIALETARSLQAVVLLKGSRTLIASPDGSVIGLPPATGWLATAGTGDVLAGVIGALVAANPSRPLAESAASAALVHALAAAIASGVRDGSSGHPIVALDVAEALPAAIGELLG